MRRLLFIIVLTAMGMGKGLSQSLIQTYVDRCTGQVSVFTVPMNGQTTVAFYSKARTFTSTDFQNGTLQSWLEETYLWWATLNPCSTATTGAVTTQQQTQQTTQQATQAATNAAASTAATNPTTNAPPTTSSPPPATQTSSPPPTDTSTANATTDTSGTSTAGTDASSTGTNETTTGGTEASTTETQSGSDQTDTSSTETTKSTEESGSTDTSEGSSAEGSKEETSTESSSESTEETSEVETEETTEESSKEESTEEKKEEETKEEETKEEEKKEEETEEESKEEESEEESKEEESEEESEDEAESEEEDKKKKDEKKKKKKRAMAPPIISANMLTQQSPLGGYDVAASFGLSQSSLLGDKTYGVTAMAYSNGQQFMLTTNFSKVHINKEGRVNYVYSASLGGAKMFTTYMGMVNNSVVFLGKKGSAAGFAFGTSITSIELDVRGGLVYYDQNILGASLTGFYTKPIQYSPKLTITPMIAISAPFASWSLILGDKITFNKDLMFIGGPSVSYKLTQRFGLNIGATAVTATIKDFPVLMSYMIGGGFSF